MIAERDFAGRRWQGTRDYQEDSYLFCPLTSNGLLTVISDGMGGHDAGADASQLTVKAFAEHCHDKEASAPPAELLAQSLDKASEAVQTLNVGTKDEDLSGCTLVATIIRENRLWFSSVGDSPLYLFRNDQLFRLNRDHSMKAILKTKLLFGEITEEEYRKDRTKNMLLSAITGEPPEMIDAPPSPRPLEENDIIILATDGVFTVKDEEIAKVCRQHQTATMETLTREIIDLIKANAGSNQDNTTVAAFRYQKTESTKISP